MPIISFIFFAFVIIVFGAIYIYNRVVKREMKRIVFTKWILLVASYVFIAYADYRFAVVLAVHTLIVWICSKNKKYIKLGILASVFSLGYFKYTNFFAESLARLIGKEDFNSLHIILPLGISFYTFSAIGYLMDVMRDKENARPLIDVALYLSFFPKITSGPIQTSKDFFVQINRSRNVGWNTFSIGIQIFCFGLFKKIVLADRLSVFVNQVFDVPLAFSGITVLLAVLAYALQIYLDFSGYSDMAIGVAEILDIHLPRNFNLPYLSHNVTEFWKRWHITLSSWLQEYLYVSLGGNRKGKLRTYTNLILTMVIGGIWHGPSWTYVIWGLLHGLALVTHKVWMKITGSAQKPHSWISNAISTTITFLFVCFCWVFFRADSVSTAIQILGRISTLNVGIQHPNIWVFFTIVLLLASSVAAFVSSGKRELPAMRQNHSCVNAFYPIGDLSKFWHLVLFFVFCGLIAGLAYTGGSPFIYGAY